MHILTVQYAIYAYDDESVRAGVEIYSVASFVCNVNFFVLLLCVQSQDRSINDEFIQNSEGFTIIQKSLFERTVVKVTHWTQSVVFFLGGQTTSKK